MEVSAHAVGIGDVRPLAINLPISCTPITSSPVAGRILAAPVRPLPEVIEPLDAAGRCLRGQEQRKNAECGMRNAE
jgi:hypothetical protein